MSCGHDRPAVWLFRYVATRHQHRNDDHHFPDGLHHSATQNKDTRALELKLNEIVAAISGASNRLIDVESLTSAELELLHKHYCELAELAKKETSLTKSHSIEEALARHRAKKAP